MADEEDLAFTELPDLEHEVANGDHLSVLEALAALAAHELAGNRCQKCHMSYMKTGEISSLMLRLQKIFEEIDELREAKKPSAEPEIELDDAGKPKVVSLRDIKRANGIGNPDSQDSGIPKYGTKAAPRRSSSRKSRG